MRASLRAFLLYALVTSTGMSAYPPLPSMFATRSGQIIESGHVTAISDKGVKIMHGGGLSQIPMADLPNEVQTLLGNQAAPVAFTDLPDPMRAGGVTYEGASVLGIDPDGVRIKHKSGTAKIRYELLDATMQKILGGFSEEKAEAFRQEQQQSLTTAQRQIAAATQPVTMPDNATGPAVSDLELNKLRTDKEYLTPSPQIKLAGRSQGGKSRYEPWKTDYGSYQRVDTSSRQYMLTVSSVSRLAQRVRVQCFLITRNVNDRIMDVTKIADHKVDLGPLSSKTVGAVSIIANSDDKYVALGARDRSGDKYLGWTWRAIDGHGRIVSVASSISGYDHYALEQPIESAADQ